jgi:hypothetical protein
MPKQTLTDSKRWRFDSKNNCNPENAELFYSALYADRRAAIALCEACPSYVPCRRDRLTQPTNEWRGIQGGLGPKDV